MGLSACLGSGLAFGIRTRSHGSRKKICVGGLCRRVCVGKVCVEFVSGRAIDVAVVVAVAVTGGFDSDPVKWDNILTEFLTSCCSESERLTLARKVIHVSDRPRHSGYNHSPSVTHGSRYYECHC